VATKRGWGGKHELTLEQYHAVPERWAAMGLARQLEALGGTFDLGYSTADPPPPGISADRSMWYRLSDGVRADDAACIEVAVRFIEDRFISSYSGFTRARLARALKHVRLSQMQRERLSAHFLALLESGDKSDEFTEYLRLWPRVISPKHRGRAHWRAESIAPSSPAFARRVIAALAGDNAVVDASHRARASTGGPPRQGRVKRRPRWLDPSLVVLKAAADHAGSRFREARRDLARANLDYECHVVSRRYMKPVSTAGWELTPERLAAAEVRSLAALRGLDERRTSSRLALEEARSNLERTVTAFRVARKGKP